MNWEQTEIKVYEYIKSIVPDDIEVIHYGKSDSSLSDLKLVKNGEELFYIEIKQMQSQAGQFVVLDNGEKFVFSRLNKVDNKVCLPIIEYINNNYDNYKKVGTAGLEIRTSSKLNEDRIISLYKNEKNVKFIATIDKNENVIIFKTDDLPKYFHIAGFLRRKRSGSSNISKSNKQIVINEMTSYLKSIGIDDNKVSFKYIKNYFVMLVDENVELYGRRIETDDFVIFVSREYEGGNILTRLSNTNNPNVIFSLELKEDNPGTQEDDFIDSLK